MFVCRVMFLGALAACQSRAAPPERAAPVPIEVLDANDVRTVLARVVPGHPCRAVVDGLELLVGGRPLIAQLGSARWTGEDAANGTTLRKNDQTIARIHANQLFDEDGIPVLRISATGDISDATGVVVRRAVHRSVGAGAGSTIGIQIGNLIVTGTSDLALAAMLTARNTSPEVRALAACHFLLTEASLP